jgi:Mo-co oxidoreductase dimerisation domain
VDAELGPKPGASSSWRSWSFDWDARPGERELVVRATDEAGNVQPDDPQWNYGGFMNNTPHRVSVLVR